MSKFTWDSELAQKALTMYTEANKDNSQLENIADSLGTTVPSVRGKLAIMGEYTKEVATSKKGATTKAAQTKSETLKAIEIMLSVPAGEFASLDKGTVKAINALLTALKAESTTKHASMGLKES